MGVAQINTRDLPNGLKKKTITLLNRKGSQDIYTMSMDTQVIRHRAIGQWLLAKIPAKPADYNITLPSFDTQSSSEVGVIGNLDTTSQAVRYHQLEQKPKRIDWSM